MEVALDGRNVGSGREEIFKLSSHVLDRIFPRSLCDSGIQTAVCIRRSDSRVMECISRSFLRRSRACSGIHSVACNIPAAGRSSFCTAERHKGRPANLCP